MEKGISAVMGGGSGRSWSEQQEEEPTRDEPLVGVER
jgi:hypothetical protein